MLNYNLKALVKTFVKAQGKVTYNRQSFYFFLMKSGKERKEVVNMIKEESEKQALPYNSGIVCKETKAAEACLNKSFLCNIYNKGKNSAYTAEKIIESIAQSMQNNRLNYNTLFESESEKPKAKTKAERIIDFVNTLSKSDLLTLEKAIEKRRALFVKLEKQAEAEKAQAAKAEKAQEKAEKARKAKQEKARKAKAAKAEKAQEKAKAEKAKAALALPKAQAKAKDLFTKAQAAQAKAEKARKAGSKAQAAKAKAQAEKISAKAQAAAKKAKETAKKAA